MPLTLPCCAVDLEPFLPVAAHRHDQVKMAQAAVGKVHVDEPAVGIGPLKQARLHGRDLAA